MARKIFITLFFGLSLLVVFFAPNSVDSDVTQILSAPSWQHIFGFDSLGRDLFLRILSGAKLSISIGALGAAFAVSVALSAVVFSSLHPSLKRFFEMCAEWFSSFPSLLLGLLLLSQFSKANLAQEPNIQFAWTLLSFTVAFALSHWMGTLRLLLQAAQGVQVQAYYQSAIAMGASKSHLFWVHVFPALKNILRLQFLVLVSHAILFESALGFLGFGISSPLTSWGALLQEGWKNLSVSPHLLWAPAMALMAFLFCLRGAFQVKSLD